MAEDPDSHGKLLWDVVALRLTAQAGSQTALVGRAKDLMGTATIASSITGVILNDKLFAVVKGDVPIWWTLLAGAALVLLFGSGLMALWPRDYSFAPEAQAFYSIEQEFSDASAGELYRSLAQGYVEPLADGETLIAKNQEHIARLDLIVRIESIALVALAGLAFFLAFVIEIMPEVPIATGGS